MLGCDSAAAVRASASTTGGLVRVTLGGRVVRYTRALAGNALWLASAGRTWAVAEHSVLEGESGAAGAGGPITSPMPGTVLVVKVALGEHVAAGQPLLVVEAMKMEHTVTAKVDGVVSELPVRPGQQVALEQTLAVVTPPEDER